MRINNIAKNTSYFTAALVLQKVISFTYFAILARNLPPELLGKYYFAISFTTIFAIFIDLGLANVLTREVARLRQSSGALLSTVLAIKIPLAALALGTVALLVNLTNYPELTRHLVYISSISMILDSFTLTFYSVIRGHHNLFFESIGSVVFQFIALTCGLIALKTGQALTIVIGAMAVASAFNFCFSFFWLRWRFKIKIRPRWDFKWIKRLAILSAPFGLFAVFQRLYMYLDTVLLSALGSDFHVGLYQIAFKIVLALQFLPMAFTASLYPAMASYWKDMHPSALSKGRTESKQPSSSPYQGEVARSAGGVSQLTVTFERAMNYLLIISLPISIGIMTLSDKIIQIFKPEYAAAILPLQIIIAAVPFMFLNFPIGSLLNACDRQKLNTLNMGIVLAISIIMNIILIPRFGAVGASITVLATNILMFIIGLSIVSNIISYRPNKIIGVAIRVMVSVLAMAAVIVFLKAKLNLVILIILGAIIYFTLMFVLGGIKKEDLVSIIKSFTPRNS